MRSDMRKVVTEAPRAGSSNKSLKTGHRLSKDDYDKDDSPYRHPISRYRQHGYDAKEFSDVLGPLRRFLRKNVGRPWDMIYSEMSQSLDNRTVSGRHIWTHVFGEVIEHCEIREDGKVYEKRNRHYPYDTPIEGLYIHPVSRILCYKEVIPWRKKFPQTNYKLMKLIESYGYQFDRCTPKFVQKNWIVVDELRLLEKIGEVWKIHTFKQLDPLEVIEVKILHGEEIPVRRGDKKGALLKRRVSSRQIGRRDKVLWRLAHDV